MRKTVKKLLKIAVDKSPGEVNGGSLDLIINPNGHDGRGATTFILFPPSTYKKCVILFHSILIKVWPNLCRYDLNDTLVSIHT